MFLKHLINWNYFINLSSPDDAVGVGDVDVDTNTNVDDADKDDDADPDNDKDDSDTDSDDDTDTDGTDDDKDDKNDKDDEDKKDEKDDDTEKLSTIDEAAIKKDFPELFKKYPDLKAELFKAEQYSELFSDPKDAENAIRKASVLDNIEKDLLVNADPSNLLDVIKKENGESYKSVSLSILPYLQKNDKELYYEVASLPIKQLLRAAWAEGKGKDTDLGRAAAFIHKYFFGDTDIAKKVTAEEKISNSTKEESKAEKEYKEKLSQLENERYTDFKNDVDSRYTRQMSDLIREGLDKDDRINDYMKDKLIEDILIDIRKSLNGDERFTKSLDGLWQKAKGANFSKEHRIKILQTVLGRTKAMVPEARKKAISLALRTKKAKIEDKDKDDKDIIRKAKTNSGDHDNGRKPVTRDKPLTDLDILRS